MIFSFQQLFNCKLVKPTRCCMDLRNYFIWESMFNHFNWLECCLKRDLMNVLLIPSMMSFRNFFILWRFDVATYCGSFLFFGELNGLNIWSSLKTNKTPHQISSMGSSLAYMHDHKWNYILINTCNTPCNIDLTTNLHISKINEHLMMKEIPSH
jgi:hypothetical protein